VLKEVENGTVKGTYFGLFITLQTPMILSFRGQKNFKIKGDRRRGVLLYAVGEVRLRGRPCSGVKTEIRAFGYLVYLPNS
jgi:hypothetical protein